MRDNNSYFPSDHIHPLQILENLNHPMIPKLISYDNETYTCEHIEGISLEKYVRKHKAAAFALKVLSDMNNLMYDLTKFTKINEEGQLLQFSCEDIHEANFIVTEDGKPYIIDFDQFGFWHSYTIFRLLQSTNYRLCDSIRASLLIASIDSERADSHKMKAIMQERGKRIKKLEKQLLKYV